MFAALLAVTLLFPSAVLAAPQATEPVETIEFYTPPSGGCDNHPTGTNIHNFRRAYPFNFTTVRGVRAKIWSEDRIARCTGGVDVSNGSSYWVSLEPASGSDYYNSTSAILQIGVTWCFDFAYPGNVCDDGGEHEPQLFWAEGGCNGATPQAKGLGPSPSGGITFEIEREVSTGRYRLEWTASSGAGFLYVSATNPATSCWLNGSGDNSKVHAAFSCERWDPGDSCGVDSIPGYYVGFRDVRVQKSIGGYWLIPGTGNPQYGLMSSCSENGGADDCEVISSDDFNLWTNR